MLVPLFFLQGNWTDCTTPLWDNTSQTYHSVLHVEESVYTNLWDVLSSRDASFLCFHFDRQLRGNEAAEEFVRCVSQAAGSLRITRHIGDHFFEVLCSGTKLNVKKKCLVLQFCDLYFSIETEECLSRLGYESRQTFKSTTSNYNTNACQRKWLRCPFRDDQICPRL